MPPQKRVKGHDRVDLRRMQVQVSGHILDRFRLDVAVLLLSQQQHWNQCRSFSGVDREQMLELVLRFFREHLPFPLERPFFPGVNVAGEDNCNKQQHLEESKELQFAVHDGPGEKKNGLNIEEKEQHGDEIELHGETLARGTDRMHSTFVGRELSGIRFLRATGVREDQRDGAESSDKNEENQNWHPAFEHASELPRRANSVDYARNDLKLMMIVSREIGCQTVAVASTSGRGCANILLL